MFHDHEDDAPKIRMNGRQKLLICCVDVAVLVELCVSMALASANPDSMTPVFMKTFFSMFLPTLAAGIFGHRMLRDRAENA